MKFTEYGKKDGDTVILLHGAGLLLTGSMSYYLFWMDMTAAIGLLLP